MAHSSEETLSGKSSVDRCYIFCRTTSNNISTKNNFLYFEFGLSLTYPRCNWSKILQQTLNVWIFENALPSIRCLSISVHN